MMPDWFAALFRKTSTRRPTAGSPRPRTLLHLEGLEGRELLSTVVVEPPAWWSLTSTSLAEETVVVRDPDAADSDHLLRIHFGPAGLVGLLNDFGVYASLDVGTPPSASAPLPIFPYGEEPPASPPVPAARPVILVQVPARGASAVQGSRWTDPATPTRAEPELPTAFPKPAPAPVAQVAAPIVAHAAPATLLPPSPPDSPVVASPPVVRPSPVAQEIAARPVGTPDVVRPVVAGMVPPSVAAVPSELRPAPSGVSDGVLLRRFADTREQAAFTELVQRHGRSVLAVCTRAAGDADLARDASQATFVALARRAAALDDRGSLAGWLHQVARRMGLRYRAAAARRRRVERAAAELYPDADDSLLSVDDEDLFRALREELDRLPDKYRVPLALCYLDGRTHAEVAAEVGLPRGSVAKRIGEGLDRLRAKLAARGVPQ